MHVSEKEQELIDSIVFNQDTIFVDDKEFEVNVIVENMIFQY